MRKIKVKKEKVCIIILIVAIIFLGIYLFNKFRIEKSKEINFKGVQTFSKQKQVLDKYHILKSTLDFEDEEVMIPVPGLNQTMSLNKNHIIEECNSMTPQGLAVTDEYIFTSAYCYNHIHNSVIYILDKEDQSLINTVVIHGTPHAGGLAFDEKNQNLWVTTSIGMAGISLKDLLEYDLNEIKSPIWYIDEVELYDIPKTSVITYYESFLIAGYFKKSGVGKLTLYKIDNEGFISDSTVESLEDDTEYDVEYGTEAKAIDEMQGIVLYDKYVLISQSYGSKDSNLYIFDMDKSDNIYNVRDATFKITFPPYLEQIAVYKNDLYAIFESGSKAYRKRTNKHTDHIIKLNLKKLIDNAVKSE